MKLTIFNQKEKGTSDAVMKKLPGQMVNFIPSSRLTSEGNPEGIPFTIRVGIIHSIKDKN